MRAIFVIVCLCLCMPEVCIAKDAVSNPAMTANERANQNGLPVSRSPEGPVATSTIYTNSPALAPGAVTVQENADVATDLDDYDSTPAAEIADPIEPWNRFWFHFNDIFYIYIAKPVYTGWTYITPQFLRTGLSNLYYNALFPTRFINSLLQFRFFEAGVEFSRFMMNIMGSAGTVNLAKNKKSIVPVDPSGEDFGQTLGRWGFGQGFYIIWPFIGPSSVRDTFGLVGDYFTEPFTYIQPWEVSWGTKVGFRFNDLGTLLPTYEDLKSIAVDPYIAMREAYAAMRQAQVKR